LQIKLELSIVKKYLRFFLLLKQFILGVIMNKKLVGFAVAATLSFSGVSAAAEDMYRGAWYGGAGISAMDTDNDIDSDNGVGAYITIGKELSQSWDLQGRFGYTEADESNLGSTSGEYKSSTLELDALYMFSRDKFRPFLLAGIGVAKNDLDYSPRDEDKTSWLASVGLGAQYLITENFGFQADLRHQMSRAKVLNSTATDSSTETIGNNILSLGGFVRFGAPAAVVAAAAPEPAPMPVAAEAAPAPAPAPVCEERLDTITIDASKLFGFDKSKLQDAGRAELDIAADKIKANADITNVLVIGHTDLLGTYEYNQALSERRATQVAQYLASQGVNSNIITATGRGESVPVVACEGIKARKALIECLAPNRRVTIEANVKETVCK
jgi:OOP family OmpA-OmpF porin